MDALTTPFFMQYPDGNYVAIDPASGYPYRTSSIFRAKLFASKEEADGYRGHFKTDNMSIRKIIAITTELVAE